MKALGNLATAQSVEYEFPYCEPAAWPVDAPVLLLVAGAKSFFKADAVVPLEPSAVAVMAGAAAAMAATSAAQSSIDSSLIGDATQLPLLRAFAAAVRDLPFNMPPVVSEALQEAWLAARRAGDVSAPPSPAAPSAAAAAAAAAAGGAGGSGAAPPPAAVTDEDLHRWLTLARLVAASHGEVELSPTRMTSMLEMERTRVARCRAVEAAVRTAAAAAGAGRGGASGGVAARQIPLTPTRSSAQFE